MDTFRESSPIESIQSIDIDMDEQNYEQKQKMQEDEKQQKYRELFQEKEDGKPAKHVVSRVPVYQPEEPSNLLNVKAGRFSEVVETQYEEYIRSKNPSVMAHVIRPEPKHEEAEEEKPRDERSVKEKVISAVVGFFSRDESDDTDTPKQNTTPVEDYTGEEEFLTSRIMTSKIIQILILS